MSTRARGITPKQFEGLPKFAQAEIRRLEANVEEYRKMARKATGADHLARAFVRTGPGEYEPLPSEDLVFNMGLPSLAAPEPHGKYRQPHAGRAHLRVQLKEADKGRTVLQVWADGMCNIRVIPRSANMLWVEVEP